VFYVDVSVFIQMNFVPEIILREFLRLTKGVDESELNRAKVQLKSNMMMVIYFVRFCMLEWFNNTILLLDTRDASSDVREFGTPEPSP
jgi:hypothetical protein